MLSSGLMARVFEAFRRRAGGWPGGLREDRECRTLAADSPYRFVFCRRLRGRRAGGSAVRLPQWSLRSEDGRTAEAALLLEQGSGRLAGRGVAGVFPQGGSGLRLVGLGCAVVPGAGAGRRMVWKGGSLTPMIIEQCFHGSGYCDSDIIGFCGQCLQLSLFIKLSVCT